MRSVVSFPSRCRILVRAAIALVVACNSTAALGHAQDNKRSDAVSVISGTSVEQLTGIVEEIVIDDRVAHATYRYRELHLDDGTLVPLEGTATDALQSGSRVELTGHRHGRPMEVDAVRTLMQPQSTVAGSAAVEVEGTLSIAHSDDFTAERSRFVYEIQEDNGNHRRLNLATLPAPLRWGMRISVSGEPSSDGSSLRPS